MTIEMTVATSLKWLAAVAAAAALAVASGAQTGPAPAGHEAVNSITGAKLLRGYAPTPAQKLVQELPPNKPGGRFPPQPLTADMAMPSADPRDFRGTWYHNQDYETRILKDMYGAPLPYTMEGAKILARRATAESKGTPYINAAALCHPPGPLVQRDINFPFQVFQTEKYVEFIFEEYHGRWNIALDGDAPKSPRQYMGNSIGRWDGDTLVVTTSDFKVPLWLEGSGTPLSTQATMTDRMRKIYLGDREPYMEIVTTISDPKYYTKSWSIVRLFFWNPGMTLLREYDCEEQVGDPSEPADAGLTQEPKE